MTRSSLVHLARKDSRNRFELVNAAARLARRLHCSTRDRMADTINSALHKIGAARHISAPALPPRDELQVLLERLGEA